MFVISERNKLIFAFAAVYLIWGSTYLAIRFGLETLPPFLMSGIRYFVAGLFICAFARLRGAKGATYAQWVRASLIGFLLFVVGTGGIVVAEKSLPSGLVSLMVATVPIYVILMEWLRPGGRNPGALTLLGVIVGIAGMIILIGPTSFAGSFAGISCVLLASFSWAIGSLYARGADLPSSKLLAAGMETVSAGVIMLVLSAFMGELRDLSLELVSLKSLAAVTYLIVFGSILGFSAYVYMLKKASPTHVSTYAYVNPLVAVFLGWALGGETVSGRTIVASMVILFAVYLISRPQRIKAAVLVEAEMER